MYAQIQERRPEQEVVSRITEEPDDTPQDGTPRDAHPKTARPKTLHPPTGRQGHRPDGSTATGRAPAPALAARRSRCGRTVYFGSRAEARPASKMPNRVSAEDATSAAPDSRVAARLRPARPPRPARPR